MISSIVDDLLSRIKGQENSLDQSQLKTLLMNSLQKLDIVSRDEFDAQTAVLLRTREKLQILEQQLAAMEAGLEK